MPRPTVAREREAFAGAVLREGIVAGLVAGSVFAIFQMLLAAAVGQPLWMPWAYAASILLGQSALALPFSLSFFIVGFLVHYALSALFGLIWGAIAKSVSPPVRDSYGGHAAASMMYGLLLWLVNFQVLARIFWPWFLDVSLPGQILLHVVTWGLPLGLYLATRLRPIDRNPVQVRV